MKKDEPTSLVHIKDALLETQEDRENTNNELKKKEKELDELNKPIKKIVAGLSLSAVVLSLFVLATNTSFLTFGIFFTPVFYEASMFGKWKDLILLNPLGNLLYVSTDSRLSLDTSSCSIKGTFAWQFFEHN